ncbi:hypothetical protein [Streptomyces sp. 1222.5]|uniref:hypothetical protein n=1 Tax=Streptomyces sp. 1222.5 TaxID=1881026 RepID=UPI003D760010
MPKTSGQWPQKIHWSENQCRDSATSTTVACSPSAAAARRAESQFMPSAWSHSRAFPAVDRSTVPRQDAGGAPCPGSYQRPATTAVSSSQRNIDRRARSASSGPSSAASRSRA